MTERPYTDDDLRAEAARQLSAHGPGAHPEQTYAAMLDARIESTSDTDGPTWSEALDAPELNVPALAIHDLINGAADVSEWAVNLGADGLEPTSHTVDIDSCTLGGQFVRLHFAFHPGAPEDARARFVAGLRQAINTALTT